MSDEKKLKYGQPPENKSIGKLGRVASRMKSDPEASVIMPKTLAEVCETSDTEVMLMEMEEAESDSYMTKQMSASMGKAVMNPKAIAGDSEGSKLWRKVSSDDPGETGGDPLAIAGARYSRDASSMEGRGKQLPSKRRRVTKWSGKQEVQEAAKMAVKYLEESEASPAVVSDEEMFQTPKRGRSLTSGKVMKRVVRRKDGK